jgi:exosortase
MHDSEQAPPMTATIARPKAFPLTAVALAAVGAWLYAPAAVEMVRSWATQDNASHGFLVLPIAAYLAWLERARVREAYHGGATAGGLLWAAAAIVLYLGGRWMEIEFALPLSLVLMIGAQVVYFAGWSVLRAVAFPYAFLFFMVPWPDLLVEFISFPMQLMSAKYATMMIGLLGIPVTGDGVDIHLARYSFTVAVPCSGMNSLVALMALAALLAYLARGAMWRRVTLFVAGIPIALAANVARIVVILLIATFAGAKAAEGFFHGASGVVVFMFALAGLLVVVRALGLRGILADRGKGGRDAAA